MFYMEAEFILQSMKNGMTRLRFSMIISLFLVLPFMILEWVNRRHYQEDFPILLFIVLWLLPVLFMAILLPILQSARTGTGLMAQPVYFFFRIISLSLIAWLWTNILLDQMPCFLGVVNCD